MSQKEQELYEDRLKKLQKIRDLGNDPFPSKSERTIQIRELLENFDDLEETKKTQTIVGRIRALREHGSLLFGNIEDQNADIQFLLKADVIGEDKFQTFNQVMDIGDIVQLEGSLMRTKRGEMSISVDDFVVLTKSLRALPEKWHGLKDAEMRLRKRYLDMLANPEVREMFEKKAKFWKTVREFMENHDFLEVEHPAFELVPGGAEAEPFVTHHKALDQDFYLRISLELPLKKLLVGGFEKVYEIGKIFRNEGVSREHLQDYTQMEFYWAYADYNDLKEFLPRLFREVIEKVFGTLKLENQGRKVDWGKKWKDYDYYELFEKYAGLDLSKATEDELRAKSDDLGIKTEKFAGRGRLIDQIYKKMVRPNLIDPGFLIDPPVDIEPLAKRLPSDPDRVQRLQIVAWGTELGKGFTELNDPLDQRQRFEAQAELREKGDEEAQMMDESFVEALEYGMPPAAGFGMSERLFALLMDKPIREIVISPPMKGDSGE